MEKVAEQEGVTVVPCFIGHGIGSYFHGPPDIYHCCECFWFSYCSGEHPSLVLGMCHYDVVVSLASHEFLEDLSPI